MKTKTVILMVCVALLAALTGVAVAETPEAAQIESKPVFTTPIKWVGSQEPPAVESQALLADIHLFETGGITAGFDGLDKFLNQYPQSAWAPVLHANLAEFYRAHGRYTLALGHWESAWNATKNGRDAASQKLAARAVAGWTRLLASLGEKEKISALFKEINDLQLPLGVYGTTVEETKEGLIMMNTKPGNSYRCGSFALGHLAMALHLDKEISRKLFDIDSPDGGFHMSELLVLAETNGMAVEAVRQPAGAELVVPSVVHWRLNHYAAITEKRGSLYRVEDPTFEREVWMDAATIEAEAGGEFILPKDKVPAGWRRLTDSECAAAYGKGYPNQVPDQQDTGPTDCGGGNGDTEDSSCDPPAANDGASGDGGDDGCCDGMPQWSVSEPYTTLWLKDSPLLYRQSNGKWMRLKLSYKHRGEAQNPYSSGFGDKWSCNWLGMLQSQSGSSTVNNFMAGGGVLPFKTDNTPNIDTAAFLKAVPCGQTAWASCPGPNYAIVDSSGSQNGYGIAMGALGTTNILLTHRFDQYGRLLEHFIFQTNGGLMLITNMVDMDGRTNTLAYGNTNYPNLITAVTDPYGHSAYFNYNTNGLLTNIVDAQGLSSYFQYDSNENITNMVTAYGTNSFQYFSYTNVADGGAVQRGLWITEASGDRQLYVYQDRPLADFWDMASFHWNRAQFADLSAGAKTNILNLTSDDCGKASVKHWLHGDNTSSGGLTLSDSLSVSADAYDPVISFRPNYFSYTYQGQADDTHTGDSSSGALKRIVGIYDSEYFPGPGVEQNQEMGITRNGLGRPTSYTYYSGGSPAATYTNIFDSSGTILQQELGPQGELTRGYGYDPVITNLLTSVTNAMGDVIRYTHDTNTLKVTSISFPGGLLRTNIYYASGPTKGFLQMQADIGFRTNYFAYTNGNLCIQTNELGLVTVNTWDNLNRLTSTTYPDGTTISNIYNKLDIVATKDRLNQWTYYAYNAVRQVTAVTNANSQITLYDYCGCGSPDTITRFNGSTPVIVQFTYDMAGRLTNALYPDNYQIGYTFDYLGRCSTMIDGAGNQWSFSYTRLGLKNLLTGVDGAEYISHGYDPYGRMTSTSDANGITTTNGYDFLGRLFARQTFGGSSDELGLETFTNDVQGLESYGDQLGHVTTYGRDAVGRVLYETNANNEVLQFAYNPADELLSLTDGKNQTTKWGYDVFGRVTNKVDAANNTLFAYQYDPLDRLTNRWSIAKSNTVYRYDPVGNLTNVVYLGGASSTSPISFFYDGLNRLTNMVDGAGGTVFNWTGGDQLQSEGGRWPNDTVSYTYNGGRQRVGFAVQAPNASPWKQSYAWDSKLRLTQVLSPGGQFGYNYPDGGNRIYQLFLTADGSTYVQNYFGFMGQVGGAALMTPQGEAAYFGYSYDQGMELTQKWFTTGNSMIYTYDNIGQLTGAQGSGGEGPRLQEQFGYAYDKAWNLNRRTNNALVETFNVNNLNELTTVTNRGTLTVAGTATETPYDSPNYLTGVTVSGTGLSSGSAELYGDGTWARTNATPANGNNTYTAIATDTAGRWSTNSVTVNLPATNTCSYDLNGNLLSDGTRYFAYDDENQLVSVTVSNVWRSEFVYDGLLRRRIARDYRWDAGTSGWLKTNEVRYVYDGNLVVQERDQNNLPLVTYTRGWDLSKTLDGAGGIGGLLARTDMGLWTMGSGQATALYFSDGNGNVATLVNTNGLVMASYNYDPFGNILSMSGPLASANSYRFSSKEWNEHAGLYYYGRRFYDPILQRWLNRDPLGDFGNLDSLTPSLDGKSDDADGMSDDKLFDTWKTINLNLFGAFGNNPVNVIDAEGHCSLAGGATPEGAEIIAEELGDGAETAAQAGARKEAEEAAVKKAEQQAAKQAAEKASEKVAKAMAKQIERDLGKDARREFHDADHLTDRTLNQLKQDAKDVYDAHGATCPAWMQP